RGAEGKLGEVMTRLQASRDAAEASMRLVTEARTEQAALGERSSGYETDVRRLEEAALELEGRILALQEDLARIADRRRGLETAVVDNERQLDEDVRSLEGLKQRVRDADDTVVAQRGEFGANEQAIRGARHALEAVRSDVMQLEVARATAAADLSH